MADPKKLPARFFRQPSGAEPVRKWLKEMPERDRRLIGNDIATAEYGWPIGMPLCLKVNEIVWEIRVDLPNNRIARVFFGIDNGGMILLHGIIKKSQKTPAKDIDIATRRMKGFYR